MKGDKNNSKTKNKRVVKRNIKDSVFTDPKTYMIEVTINSNYQSLNNYLDKLSILEPEGE